MRVRLVLWAALAFGGAACAHGRPPSPDRFLYQLSCDAKLERFDTVTQKRTGAYDLTKVAGVGALIPAATGPLEVCLTRSAVVDSRASVFYTVVPSQAQPAEDGPTGYRVLGFSLPSVALVVPGAGGSVPVPFDAPPRLVPDPSRGARTVGPSDPPPALTEDLSLFAGAHSPAPNRILETSRHRALLSLTGEAGPAFAVADEGTHSFVRLQGPMATTVDNVHLAPGGTHVLVEETSAAGGRATKTGRVWLYDAATGAVSQTIMAPQITKLPFRGISPDGKVLYDLLDDYWFLDLGRTFTADPVERPLEPEFPPPAVFFSDR